MTPEPQFLDPPVPYYAANAGEAKDQPTEPSQPVTPQVDWNAMSQAERALVTEEASRVIRLQADHPATNSWRALSEAERGVFVGAAIAEMQRAGVVNQDGSNWAKK